MCLSNLLGCYSARVSFNSEKLSSNHAVFDHQVICLDGDGGLLMHMGCMATIGQHGPANFKHILINNGCHDSVGGQPTNALQDNFDFLRIAQACGYAAVSCGQFTLVEEIRVLF